MKTYDAGEILLVDTGDDDVIVARVTGELAQSSHNVALADWREAGLALPSRVRLHKLATLEKRLVERRLGKLTEGDMQEVRAQLANIWTGLLESQVNRE